MGSLLIRHVTSGETPQFQVVRLPDGKSIIPVPAPAPVGFPVEGRPNSDLMTELRWYLEFFLEYPFSPETEHAERVQSALRAWGEQAFTALFGDAKGGRMFADATKDGLDRLQLQISSDDPRVLSWPWEALRDKETGVLGQTCQFERRLEKVSDPQPLSDRLPTDRVNILLLTARPFEGDVRYRSMSRPLVELIDKHKLPAKVTVLRPPTLDRLREHLRERPDVYHILHFDGHGSYRDEPAGGAYTLRGPVGRLIFEDGDGKPDAIASEQLSVLLREHRIPAVVLNACQSGMVDHEAEDAFASVAASLVQSGIRSVVAMAYSLYVSGGQKFLPAFYRRLFESGSVAEATRAGRQQMVAEPDRVCARGKFPLQDWLVPVLYQQEPFDFSFTKTAKVQAAKTTTLPEEVRDEENPYGFIGRDGAILELERAMRRPPAGILIHGLGGVGKTTLARGFVQWLDVTEGLLPEHCFWFTFQEIRTAEYVFNRLGETLFSAQFITKSSEEKIDLLAAELYEKPCLIIWDNFEVVRGMPGTAVESNLPAEDQSQLLDFLKKLRGGKTKVLITSRSEEDWLGHTNCYKLKGGLGGLQGEECWEYCAVILCDLGITINRKDPDLVKLMNLLDGHPLAMRIVLPRLEKMTAAAIVKALQSNLADLLDVKDAAHAKLFATLRFAEQSLPDDLHPLLIPLALHEHFVVGDFLEEIAKQVDAGWPRDRIDRFLETLSRAGLLRDRGASIHEIHPALIGFLRSALAESAAETSNGRWYRAFVRVMASQADGLTPLKLHENQETFHVLIGTFHRAVLEAERLAMDEDCVKLIQSLAIFALNIRNFKASADLFARLAALARNHEDSRLETATYHQMGRIAEERHDHENAEQWYRRALKVGEVHGNQRDIAIICRQLGTIALEQRDFPAAEEWCRRARDIDEKHRDLNTASTYHLQGLVAQKRRDFPAAEMWYLKSLEIKAMHGDVHGAASTYHQMGTVAQERGDVTSANQWYQKSLGIREKCGDKEGASGTYHQLGTIAHVQHDLSAAKEWLRKSLEIKESCGDEHGAANTYHALGMVAQEEGDFAAAEEWYGKSLAIHEKHRDQHGAFGTYHQLGVISALSRDFSTAEQRFRKSLEIAEKHRDEHGVGVTYASLGLTAGLQNQIEKAGECLIKGLTRLVRTNDPAGADSCVSVFQRCLNHATAKDRIKLKALWDEAGLGPLPDDTEASG